MKTRMAIDDISAMVGSIQKNVVNMRVTNIYDAEVNKTYILKLATPGLPKVFLLLQSGTRFHTTAYARETASALPLQFTMKLRKHLRGKRLASVTQCASDRVIDFCFGDGDQRHHLILELYAAGNIILTDDKYTILSLLRTHAYDEQVKVAVKQIYPIDNELVVGNTATSLFATGDDLSTFIQQYVQDIASKEKSKKQYSLKQILMSKESGYGAFGPTIVEHCMVEAGISPSLKVKTATSNVHVPLSPEEAQTLVDSLKAAPALLEELSANQVVVHGEHSDANDTSRHGFIVLNDHGHFDEFTPYLYAQHRGKAIQEFHTFDQAVDEFFSKIEAQAAEAEKKQAAQVAETKVDKLKKHQQEQMAAFRRTQEDAVAQATLVEQNQQDIENVLLVIRSALASGMDWTDLDDLIKQEQHNGNPVATLIHKLDLAQNRVHVLLCDVDADDEAIAHCVAIDLSLSALANARELYSKKKTAVKKAQKAIEATDKAIEQAVKKHDKKQQQQQLQRKTMYQRRKVMWFEKFHWFITREKYLVLAGKDAQQNETLVKRYLRKGDIYVHADLHGAATCIVRNKVSDGSQDIPASALEQAGCMSVCRSNAWSNQVVAGAYWVHADQVSKTAPTGEYLTTGSFMIRGKKNYIPASRLEMGLAIIFRIDESSVRNHIGDQDEEDDDQHHDGQGDESRFTEVDDGQDKATDNAVEVAPKEKIRKENPIKEKPTTPAAAIEATLDPSPAVDEEAPTDTHDVVLEDESTSAGKPGKKIMSAKERRDLKKKKAAAHDEAEMERRDAEAAAAAVKQPKAKTSTPAPVRGKQGKLKKMKKKYADQDEDERVLRMQLLGHAVVPTPSEAGTEDVEPSVAGGDEDDDDDESKAGDDVASSVASIDEEKEAFFKMQRERKMQLLEQEEEEAQNATFLETFTGNPLPNDILLFAMPMCAPYSTLELYTYKVKLTPGTQKKGKAVQFAVDHFLKLRPKPTLLQAAATALSTPEQTAAADQAEDDKPDMDPLQAQKELIKCVPEGDLVGCIVGPVKVSAPGLNSATMKKATQQKPKKAHKNKSTK
ncbi:Aste57867_21883 [Aphanomyces stellatus]|uniref:Ribosome quality control complex subunit 2 n=1 Tax=Aphanomyces stellatus TaxID=120398 RepID=A0A485LK22_9STRA|nr:hypothetical protein As57867_021814 [Aphanomyces stellatus]VFT98551.1 Aste57867_21883 [Aphanomyces stellatus]